MRNGSKHGEARWAHLRNVCERIGRAAGKSRRNNVSNVLLVRAGKPLSKGPLASYKRKDMVPIPDDLSSLWKFVKNDAPVYLKIERTFIAANADAGCHFLKCHLKKYWGGWIIGRV